MVRSIPNLSRLFACIALALILTACASQQPDPLAYQRAQIALDQQQHAAQQAESRAAVLEPIVRISLGTLLLVPFLVVIVGLDAYRLRRRTIGVDAAGRLRFPRATVEHDPTIAAHALVMAQSVEYQRASGARSLPLAPSAPALITSTPDVPAPALPDKCDLLHALQSFTPSTERLLMGVGANGPIYRSLEQLLHVGVLGSSGSGKSTSQLAIACQLAMIDGATMAVLDPEAATFQALRTSPRLHLPFPEDGAACVENLQALQGELNERRALLSSAGAWDWLELNRDHGGQMQPVFGFIDELPTLTSYQDTEPLLLDLARRGRKCGMYLVVASQSLKREDVGSTTIRQQFATKLLLRTGETAQGRALGLDAMWCKTATTFEQPGLAVFSPNDAQPEVIRVPYVAKSSAAHILHGATIDATPASPRKALERAEPVADVSPDYAGIVRRLQGEGRGMNATIELVWGVKPGGSPAYRQAREQYKQLVGEGAS